VAGAHAIAVQRAQQSRDATGMSGPATLVDGQAQLEKAVGR
jgi:hypothetical protein